METRKCASCGQGFHRSPQVHQQEYCSAFECQAKRKQRWQQTQRKKRDPAYIGNQKSAQQAWGKRRPEYWANYRDAHPEYCERNRVQQRVRNQKRKTKLIAKMDESAAISPVLSGRYRLVPVGVTGAEIAKMDEWTVEIKFLSDTCDAPGSDGGVRR